MLRKESLATLFVCLLIDMQILFSNCQVPDPDPDYTKQSQWKGACNVGSLQSPINILTD